jgi:hypothetical protein
VVFDILGLIDDLVGENDILIQGDIPSGIPELPGDWSGILLLLRYIFSSIISWVMIKKFPRKECSIIKEV